MPVHNGMPYLEQAIESILCQTHRDLQLLIYDDGSTDGSYEHACEWAARDPRVKVARGGTRLGPTGSSNAAMALADRKYVARMDADDVSHPRRIELQLAALESDPAAVLVGSTYRLVDRRGRVIRDAMPSRLLETGEPFAHPTIMIRKADFDAVGGYPEGTDYFEDAALYARLAARGRFLVYRRPLVDVRVAGQNSRLQGDRLAIVRNIARLGSPHHRTIPDGMRLPTAPFHALAALHVLALERPRLLRTILRHAESRPLRRMLFVIAHAAVADISPRLARGIGNVVSRRRDRRRASALGDAELFVWPIGRRPEWQGNKHWCTRQDSNL